MCAPDSDPIVVIVAFCRNTLTGTKTFNLRASQAFSYGNTLGFQTICRLSQLLAQCQVGYIREQKKENGSNHIFI